MSKQETKTKETTVTGLRPIGLSISSLFYAVAGVYYLAYPLAVQDAGIWPLYVIGALSLLGSFGVMRMTRWGLWLGLGLFLPQVIAPAFALMAALSISGVTQEPIAIAFVASLFVLILFASLSFLLILDKRRTFK
ncbi:MAG TPA: hypothetical protein VFV92_16890 [Candidatus Bathyarchaeia archaeon]|nr:hypothetical protein [Candidatus Bathyarchaeia archaeon]